ncbi:MAG: hypothetical protein ACJA08_002320 [Cyclobacteriaceae bacterium]|jgi:hypothetical protein
MNLSDKEFEKQIDQLDTGSTDQVSTDLLHDYQLMVKGVSALSEEEFKQNLDKIHQSMHLGTLLGGRQVVWISGIAATLIGAFFWWQSMNPKLVSPKLQMNEIPVYGDSATYDSLKNIQPTVDIEKK